MIVVIMAVHINMVPSDIILFVNGTSVVSIIVVIMVMVSCI
jgi:hypothetical protein